LLSVYGTSTGILTTLNLLSYEGPNERWEYSIILDCKDFLGTNTLGYWVYS